MASVESGIGRPVARAMSGAMMTHPINPPTNTYDDICGPMIQPTPRSAGDVVMPPYNQPVFIRPARLYRPIFMMCSVVPLNRFNESSPNLYSAAREAPIRSQMLLIVFFFCFPAVSPPTVVVRTAATAIPSGKGRDVFITSALLSGTIHKTPRSPPNRAMILVSRKWISLHVPRRTRAGMVKITPAAIHSPADAPIVARFISRIVPLNGFRRVNANTAPGMIAETVIPAYRPRYAFAAPRTIARKIPTRTAFTVSSGIVLSEGINDLNCSRELISIVNIWKPCY